MFCIYCNLRDKEFMEVFIKDLKVRKVFCAVFIMNFTLLNPGSHLISIIKLYVNIPNLYLLLLAVLSYSEGMGWGGKGSGCLRHSHRGHPGPYF